MIDSDSDQDANHTPQNAEAESQQHNAMSAGGGADVGGPPEAGEQLHLLRPDAFDLQENFIWEKNVLVIDEVEEMIRLTVGGGVNRNKWRNRLVESMYQLACSLAWQEVASQETRTDKVSLHRLLATAFEGVVANYHLKAYPREHFFLHFPERNWPTDFLAKVAEERGKAPTSAWLHKPAHVELLHRPVGEQIAVFFGKRIYDVAATCRSFIISSLNPPLCRERGVRDGHPRSRTPRDPERHHRRSADDSAAQGGPQGGRGREDWGRP